MSIFVSVAAYRDPELIPTLQNCLAKALRPDQLRFGICWQHGSDEDMPFSLKQDSRFQIIDVDWRESKGACWARSQLMGLWQGEDYYLQIDSHHRFADSWDTKLIEGAALTASPKPILTTYCPVYTPGQKVFTSSAPTQITFDTFTEDGIVTFKPTFIAEWTNLRRPVRARFVSAHFLFAPGSFVEEIPYNPNLYFIGEEITLAIRAYTHGYDLFHPSEVLLWHDYSRSGRRKHWDDHVETEHVELPWYHRDSKSRDEVSRFLRDPHCGRWGCGIDRTFGEYAAYAGINFRVRKVQDYTRLGGEPPNPAPTDNWEETTHTWKIRIVLKRSQLPAEALTDPLFWYVGIHDSIGTEIHRQDLSSEDLVPLISDHSEHIAFERTFVSSGLPTTWTVWPVARNAVWLDKTTGRV
jgi:Glycosyltransferase (GlcNAc)